MAMTGFIFLTASLLMRTAQGSKGYYEPCETDDECGSWNNVCTGGFCGCGPMQQAIFPNTESGAPDNTRYFCSKPCSDCGPCDASNHETCMYGSCSCGDGYTRFSSPKCVPYNTPGICGRNGWSMGSCDTVLNVPCTKYMGYDVTCTDVGVCCYAMAEMTTMSNDRMPFPNAPAGLFYLNKVCTTADDPSAWCGTTTATCVKDPTVTGTTQDGYCCDSV